MKKTILIVALAVLALGVLGVGTVLAQDAQPPYGGGRGPMMNGGQGALHTFMVAEFAKKLDLTVSDINAKLATGETMYSIALANGVTAEKFPAIMTEVRANALTAAVKANVITQAQADWMKTRGFGQGGGMGNGAGNCDGSGQQGQGGRGQGMRGQGQGRGGMMGGGQGQGWQNANP